MKRRRRQRGRYAVLALALLFGGACAAPNSEHGAAEESTEGRGPSVRTYVVRAQVTRIDTRAEPPLLHLHHEAIHHLAGPEGEIEGMDSMVMPFPLAGGLRLEGIAAQDIVEVELRVDWTAALPARITAIRPLPEDTVLEFGPAEPDR